MRSVILDIGMPKIDGLSLISMIREKHADLPIVMFTGLGYDEEAMQTARKAGANGYVSKGLGPSEIYSALMRVHTPHAASPQRLTEIGGVLHFSRHSLEL